MSDPVRPHRQQPTRLLCPWDSPGKNTGVGCHFLLQCMKVKSESEVTQSCGTLSDPMNCSLPGSSVHGFFQARVLERGAIAFSVRKEQPCAILQGLSPGALQFLDITRHPCILQKSLLLPEELALDLPLTEGVLIMLRVGPAPGMCKLTMEPQATLQFLLLPALVQLN